MSVHKYTSWGRTRRPKPASGTDGTYVTGSTIGALSGLTVSTSGPADGVYKTENQRYMHMICSGSNSGIDKVYTYCYAAANWSELATVDPTDGTRNSVVCGANQHIIVDINGADLVAVTTGSATFLADANYLAFSTF